LFDIAVVDGTSLSKKAVSVLTEELLSVAKALGKDQQKVLQFSENILQKIETDGEDISLDEWIEVGFSTPSFVQVLLIDGDHANAATSQAPSPPVAQGSNSTTPPHGTSNAAKKKSKKKLHQNIVKELEQKTKFGKDELEHLRTIFKDYDTDKSGDLNFSEFKKLLVGLRLFPGISDQTLEALFVSFDEDQDGTISFSEIATALSVLSKGNVQDKLAFMFDVYDIDNSGFLTKQELSVVANQMKVVAQALGRDPQKIVPFIDSVLRKADVDKDGQITKDEWLTVGASTPSLLQLLSGGDWTA